MQSAVSLLQQPKSEGDMPNDDLGDPDQVLPGYTPGWRPSFPSSPPSSPSSLSVSVSGPGLSGCRDWGWDPGGVRSAGGGLGWDPGGGAAVCDSE